MKSETNITEENLIGCKAKVGHRKGKIVKRDVWTDRCGKKGFLCYECKRNMKTHKSSCQRFLGFLEGKIWASPDEYYIDSKITELQNAIKKYEENGI